GPGPQDKGATMPFWACKKATCPGSKDPIESNKMVPCKVCHGPTVKTEVKAGATFEGRVNQVKLAVPNYNGPYQKQAIDYLVTNNLAGLKTDFLEEMSKEEDYKKFVGQKPRANTDQTNCFDNAFVNYAGGELPDGCPAGEKYEFEMPYLMSTINWPFKGNSAM